MKHARASCFAFEGQPLGYVHCDTAPSSFVSSSSNGRILPTTASTKASRARSCLNVPRVSASVPCVFGTPSFVFARDEDGAISNGDNTDEGGSHDQEDSGHDVGRYQSACAFFVGGREESAHIEGQARRSPAPS